MPPKNTPSVGVVAAQTPIAAEAPEAPEHRQFATTVGDAPKANAPFVRKLNAKTIAEQDAGRARLAAYGPRE